ncbi:CoA ester lyase [Bradyrhizobium pachyrhizi]|uniref:HpcH/HpaI aldolase/citrate lyase family protein n=1 Tax=Bradyrhizobium pachyrhizi TaxID=280333 RepID=UPI0024B1F852|nr:CoA ester lyase [Bradyrhizobium pachyrhizi]WFU55302.1 CoA ester lyase [Bradyrhizobium pachyrhizi]
MRKLRPAPLCRSWLFLEGANEDVLQHAAASGADVLIHELEDFTPPPLRPKARALAAELYAAWRDQGVMVAVRVNPLDQDGMDDLAAVMRGRPDIVALPKVAEPHHVVRLDEAVTRFERDYGIAEGSTSLLPNIEFARGLVQTGAIAMASRRVIGCLMASEDLAADLGAERGSDGLELAYARQRFIVECRAADVVAVDCPYTWSDAEGVERDTIWARRLGYTAKSLVDPAHASIVNGVLTPSEEEMRQAGKIVAAFEAARTKGFGRVELDGSLLEVPTYSNAKRLIARGEALRAIDRDVRA